MIRLETTLDLIQSSASAGCWLQPVCDLEIQLRLEI